MNNSMHNKSTRIHNFAGFIVGLVMGGLAGVGAMMLFAPQSGEETRARLKQKGIELQERTIDTMDDLVKIYRFDNRVILAETRHQYENILLPVYHFEN